MAKKKNILRAVIGFIWLSIFFVIIHMIDFAVMYSIFLYIQFLLAPFMTGIGYLFYVVRSSIPYIFMYFLICLFFNIQTYRRNSTIKIFKYTIDVNAVKKSKIYIYIRQYNYVFIIALNLILLFIVYYAYMNNKYFYLLFVFLFYLFIWIVIKIKQLLLKNETFQYKKVHMLVNLTLILLVGTYISMAIEELHIFNFRLYGFENFWKLIDNKFFIKMPSKDFNWHRLFNWSKQSSTDRYVYALKKGLIKSEIFEQNPDNLISEVKLSLDLNIKEKELLPLNSLNNESHVNVNITDYLNRATNDNYNLSKFSNAFYQKFKKVFLIQSQIKPSVFIPTPEIAERQKLFIWLKNSNNIIDLSDLYLTTDTDDALYNNYLDLVDQKFKNLTTKKVFLITLHKNYYNLKSFTFFADFEYSFKKNYALFLNSEKNSIDLKNNSSLNFEYYNSDLYLNFDFNNLLQKFKSELYIIFKENEIALSLFTQKFKSLYSIKTFKFSFKEDVLTESDNDLISELKPKSKKLIMIPDFKKLQVWKTFKLNYKEILYNHTKELRVVKPIMSSEKWVADNQLEIKEQPLNEIFFIVEDDIAYSLKDNILTQVENLTFGETNNEAELLSEFISHYLEDIKGRTKAIELISKKKFTKILINDVEKAVVELQNKKVHVPMFNSMYHEILHQNSNDFFKFILENFDISRDLLTSSRSFMTYDMWFFLMQKLLNLNTNSIWLQNLTDFNNSLHSDATDDLQYNFSLAFELLQNKYGTTKLQMIPDLDGIPGTFFEYTVKYNAHMARYYWYEEQEAVIDWIYEISYNSLVNIIDSVKVVNDKENDYLYDMVNLYKREMKYKWIAEYFDSKTNIFMEPTKKLNLLNKKLNVMNDLYLFNKHRNEILLGNYIDYKYIALLDNKSMMDFSNIKNLHDLNVKTFRDLNLLKKAFGWEHSKIVRAYPAAINHFHEIQHTDMHSNEFELMLQYYTQEQQKLNWQLSHSTGIALNYLPDPSWDPYFNYFLEDYFEIENMNKLDYLFEELNSEMQMGYDHLLETEDFEDAFVEDESILYDEFNKVLITYQVNVKKAEFIIINKMLGHEVDNKIIIGEENNELLDFTEYDIALSVLKCIELKSIELDNLPIYDFYNHAMITENIDLLSKEKPDVLIKKMDLVEKLLYEENNKLLEMKKTAKAYRIQLIKEAMEKPETKRYLNKDWDEHNYLSNKTDKFMRDWYKNGKKR